MRVVWTETALARIEDISAHIALDDPRAAIRWVEKLFSLLDSQLTSFPESGRVVPEIAETAVRELVYGDLPRLLPTGSNRRDGASRQPAAARRLGRRLIEQRNRADGVR